QANAGATANFTITSSASTFQWQLKQGSGWQNLTNTGQYTGATTNTLTIKNITTSNNNQNYRCIATINTCADTSSIGILTVKTGKIEDFKHQNLISVFPNPANNKLTIQSSTNPVDLPYSIIDQSGRELLKGSLNAKITTIDISQLAIGFYFLQVGETNKETFKLMKQ
ncbi:MAG: T9SS type A sorting domain-containing protein, partial [Bacteroidetes bacterium]|nr:T9SS type A sorting domain-containing protein [Bacteroidota bacterium]